MAELKANNISVAEVTGFTRTGQSYKAERLTFFVGSSGPFTKDFPAQQDNTVAIQQYIADKTRQLNALQGANT
jgi:hypothetical protein